MKTKYQLQCATSEDTSEILALFNELIDSYEGGINYPDWTKDVYPNYEYLKRAAENGELYKYLYEDKIVGAAVINHNANDDYQNVPWSENFKEEEVYIIHSFIVKNMCQHRGIGHKMFKKIVDLAQKNGVKAIHLDTIYKNSPAKAFYEKIGMQNLGVYDLHYEDTDETRFHLFEYLL